MKNHSVLQSNKREPYKANVDCLSFSDLYVYLENGILTISEI